MPEFSYDIMLEKIVNDEHFSFARYGDGELACIFGRKGGNCDGHSYFEDLGLELKKILESKPKYYLGIQRLGKEQNADNAEFKRLYEMNDWVNSEVLHHASIKGRLNEFFEALKGKKVILVGSKFLRKVNIAYYDFVEIPLNNCWTEHDAILRELKSVVHEGMIILYCASMMSEWLIDKMYSDKITQIDCGSVFDVTVGRAIRSYQKQMLAK